MRVFVAVEIPDAMRQVAARTEEMIRRQLAREVDARWVDPEKMHLTVRFIGHVDDARAPDLLKVLAEPVPVAPFEIALGGCGVFPPTGGPRVIWIGLDAGLPSLTEMHREYNRRLAPLGFADEERPYNAHLTLARLRAKGASARLRATIRDVAVQASRCRIDRATVFRSHMSSQGSWYEPLVYAPLGR